MSRLEVSEGLSAIHCRICGLVGTCVIGIQLARGPVYAQPESGGAVFIGYSAGGVAALVKGTTVSGALGSNSKLSS